MNLLEDDGNGRKEGKDKSPGIGDVEREQEDDGLADQQEGSTSGGNVKESLERGCLELRGSAVSLVSSLLAKLLSSAGQNDGATSLAEKQELENDDSTVDDELNPLDPSPSLFLQNVAAVERRTDSTRNGDEREKRNWETTVLGLPDVGKGSGNDG